LKLYFSQYEKKIDKKKSNSIKKKRRRREETPQKTHFGFITFFLKKNNIRKIERQKQIKVFNIAI
jgi:hypothetical protein